MTQEQLETLLVNAPNVTGVAWINENKYGFSRECEFHVRGMRYAIRWFTNICYLIIGEAEVLFEELKVTGTWPNSFKTNLNFYQDRYDGEPGIVAIIPIEEYPTRKQEATS
ncbi:hypothetical protein [Exiguobacterium sp. S22-S28]|uniref:hypothetical protein n=1 Tax=Exiguobacterium sp. S22-S28 TaxID=3342768 RepID=UPI00372D1CD2